MLRLINAALNEELFFKIAGHKMTIVEVDATYVNPSKTDTILIAPGQTTNVIISADQGAGKFMVVASHSWTLPWWQSTTQQPPLHCITQAHSQIPDISCHRPGEKRNSHRQQFCRLVKEFEFQKISRKSPKKVDHSLFFVVVLGVNPCPSCKARNGSRVVASVNNVTFVMPTIALLQAHVFNVKGVFTTDFPGRPPIPFNYTGNPPASLATTSGTKVYRLKYNDTVQVVLQDTGIIAPENHPVHLHGFNFFVVGKGLGNFNPKMDPKSFNLVDPVERNTIGVPSGVWVAIRFQADNPGVWFMHCHLEVHTTWGLKMTFLVDNGNGPNEFVLPPPKDLPKC